MAAIREKYVDEKTPLWPDQVRDRKVIWPQRFRLDIKKLIPEEEWGSRAVRITDFGLFWQKGFQRLSLEHDRELARRFRERYRWDDLECIEKGRTIESPAVAEPSESVEGTHRSLQEILAEIGRLQHYHSQLEYPIPLEGLERTLDVVWKREMSGVPTFAFEVERSGAVEKAVLRLKFAYDRWNTRPCIVVPQDLYPDVRAIVSAQEARFSERVRICSEEEILELHRRKRDLRSLEQKMGIY